MFDQLLAQYTVNLRGIAVSYKDRRHGRIFCKLSSNRIVAETVLTLIVRDAFPVTPLHSLAMPTRHVADYLGPYRPE